MSNTNELSRTPLHGEHLALKARMVPFAGRDMPVQYSGVIEEARAVRTHVGIFDISHMGRLRIVGHSVTQGIQSVTTNDVQLLTPGKAQYSLMPLATGGIADDIIVYMMAEGDYLLVVNASNTARDIDFLRSVDSLDGMLTDCTNATAMIAVQGPGACAVLQRECSANLDAVPRFGVAEGRLYGCAVTLCRTGYTGEDGFEVICDAEDAAAVWRSLIADGAVPCGLGARDSLRTEAGYPLYGHEISETTSPVEAGLMWAVKLDKGDFVGRSAIAAARERGPERKLMGVVMADRAIPRQGYSVSFEGDEVGSVTSGAYSATRGIALGMAYVRADVARAGRRVEVVIRGAPHAATLVAKKDLLTCRTDGTVTGKV